MNEREPSDNGFFSSFEENDKRLTVTKLTRIIKDLVETEIPVIEVEGEISNHILHTSGHRYFTLKDENSQIKCVMFKWQSEKVNFDITEGMKLLAIGNVTVYERGGYYQLNVFRLLPLGRGELLARLEELKKKLSAEGLFERKRPIPMYPRTIGVITSPTGAAIRDIISVIKRRAPFAKIILRPTLVQGIEAASDIVQAIKEMNDFSGADLLIVGRGGGSIEDLWCFNEESVARAIVSSGIPVISAVGHETDITLADFAADLRAPTPSAAAEIAVKDSRELAETIAGYKSYMGQLLVSILDNMEYRVGNVERAFSGDRFLTFLMMKSQNVDELSLRLLNSYRTTLSENELRLERLGAKLTALNPKAVLDRGYSLVYTEDGGLVSDSSMLKKEQRVNIELSKGSFDASVIGIRN